MASILLGEFMDFKNKLKTNLASNIAIVTYSILLFIAITNLNVVINIFTTFFSYISPFIVGIGIAFVFNLPLSIIENNILNKQNLKHSTKRSISISLTFFLFLVLIFALARFVIPQIQESALIFSSSIQGYLSDFDINSWLSKFEFSPEILQGLSEQLDGIIKLVTTFIANIVPYTIDVSVKIASSTFNLVLSFVFSVYMLAGKENLVLAQKKIIFSIFNEKTGDFILKVGRLSHKTFSGFIGGQLTEALILSVLTIVGMMILQLDYAFLIGTIVGLFSVIPIFGAIIGAIPGVVILLIISPVKALIFIIFMVVLQQVEGNLIYPKVVGNSIGISGLWIMFAMLLGGALYGVMGILLGIPAFAVFYILIREWANKTINTKNIEIE